VTGQPGRQHPAADSRPYAGKTLGARRAEQRERILLAARDAFAVHGYAETGIEEIVARARVSRTTFYLLFSNKEQCLLALLELGLERIGGAVLEAVAETAGRDMDPAERIREEVRAVAAAFAADPAMARLMLIDSVSATPVAERARVEARHAAAGVIEDQLEQYEYWDRRSPHERRVASVAAMAAIAEPISDLVATGRLDEWEQIVGPVSDFVARGLIRTDR
jgi:AcrR family transcriptional regulator